MLKFFCGVLLTLGAVSGSFAQAASVLFLNPGSTREAFWVSYSQFMQAAARDLGMDLRIVYSNRQSDVVIEQARRALQGPDRPDYLVFVNEQYVAPQRREVVHGQQRVHGRPDKPDGCAARQVR
jgi:hypothetical protein